MSHKGFLFFLSDTWQFIIVVLFVMMPVGGGRKKAANAAFSVAFFSIQVLELQQDKRWRMFRILCICQGR